MKNIKEEVIIWGQLIAFIGIWSFILLITNIPLRINFEAIKKLPDVVMIYSIILFIFIYNYFSHNKYSFL